jgi:AAA15 family ATPase/GTPase
MLISFTLGNFRSFNEPNLFSMLPISCVQDESNVQHCLINTGNKQQYPALLKSAVIYGANASGKSNLLLGIKQMQEFVKNNFRQTEYGQKTVYNPFLFSQNSIKEEPSLYEMQFLIDGNVFRYGFEILQSCVLEEWLYKNEEELFFREKQEICLGGSFSEGQGKETQTREDALFLSVCAYLNGTISQILLKQFEKIHVSSITWNETGYSYLNKPDICAKLLPLVKLADTGIQDFEHTLKLVQTVSSKNSSVNADVQNKIGIQDNIGIRDEAEASLYFYSYSAVYEVPESDDNKRTPLNIEELSSGTKKMLGLSYQILRAVENNSILIIDEIDIQLHPLLIGILLEFFHSHKTSQSQLIFTAHSTYPLRKKLLRRDQIWFVNKNADLSSQLVNFAEFKIPPEASYENDYLNGRYGGIPVTDLSDIIKEYQ